MPVEKSSAEVPSAEPVDLAELAQYAPASIVSRTILDSEVGTLTVFAFDQGQKLSEHSAPFNAFVQILDGEADLRIGGEDVHATAGQLVLMPADVPHAVEAKQRFKMLLTMFKNS